MNNKLRNRFYIMQSSLFIFSTVLFFRSMAQDTVIVNPPVTGTIKDYKTSVQKDSNNKMVEVKAFIPGIMYDLRYATAENFINRVMYPEKPSYTFLRLPAARALGQVQKELNENGLGIKIFDAYRPYSVTLKFWELVKDERYVANPTKGSNHNRGVAVDLTIINLSSGKELNMGTGFDNFTDTAHHSFTHLPEEILQNRGLLKSVMEKYGFKPLESEWWHYSFLPSNNFDLLDIDFKKLKKRS